MADTIAAVVSTATFTVLTFAVIWIAARHHDRHSRDWFND